MSFPQDGRDMDRLPDTAGGSVGGAGERAPAGSPRDDPTQSPALRGRRDGDDSRRAPPSPPRRPPPAPTTAPPRAQRPPARPGLQTRDGQIGVAISRPTQVPQWPLASATDNATSSATPYQPPPGKSQPPQRPPRPSRVPSMLDASKVQDHTPVFQYQPPPPPQPGRDSTGQELASVPETPSSLSRPSTLSSVGSIPDFPLPVPMAAPPRRSVNLGPPPSARRGASSFYSNASYVSPIPEESPRSRSHASFASSAAMPESWGSPSPGPSPNYPDAHFEDVMSGENDPSTFVEDEEDSRLVRSASLGKRGKPTLVTTGASPRPPDAEQQSLQPGQRPGPSPLQNNAFNSGTAYIDASTSSSGTIPTSRAPPTAVGADGGESSSNAANASGPLNLPIPTPSPQPPPARPYSRLSAIWRPPPRADPDGVGKGDSRASMTSLPDLIRRATRLAASLERGRRPASRFDDLRDSYGPDSFGRYGDKELSVDGEKHQSGLSDMLAAFPPPAQANNRRSFRESIRQQVQSWPLGLSNSNRGQGAGSGDEVLTPTSSQRQGRDRRCCGLPRRRFVLIVMVVLVIILAAILIPVGLLVIRRRASGADQGLQACEAQLNCANGGTNVVSQGTCACICTNGFTGSDCTVAGTAGCAATSLAGANTNINNATLGAAIPRLIQDAPTNFSIPLSPETLLAKFNAGNLSCTAENALVTFDGQAVRLDNGLGLADSSLLPENSLNVVDGVQYDVIIIYEQSDTTITIGAPTVKPTAAPSPMIVPEPLSTPALEFPASAAQNLNMDSGKPTTNYPESFSTIFATTISFSTKISQSTPTITTTTTTTIPGPPPATSAPNQPFTVSEEVRDFARVAVLFILQQETLDLAASAQSVLQRFLANASSGTAVTGNNISIDQARNVSLGNGNSIDLVGFRVDTGNGVQGGRTVAMMGLQRRVDQLPATQPTFVL